MGSITTKSGDDGTTGLMSGQRVPKDHPRIEAVGEVDELSSLLGFARLACSLDATTAAIEGLQRDLVRVAGELASIDPAFDDPIQTRDEEAITDRIHELEARIELHGFVLPGRTEGSARIDLARAACRRLEAHRRRARPGIGGLGDRQALPLNRLSDYLFMLARSEEAAAGKIKYV